MVYDVIIIGSGPAGFTAGIYCIRAGLAVILLEGHEYGGQLMNTTEVENYPGFSDGVNGFDLMNNMKNQCINLGCTIVSENAVSVEFNTSSSPVIHKVLTDEKIYETRTIIIATGATAKRLNLPNENIFWNHGISACAVCDGALPIFRNKLLIVVGAGDTAFEEALFLSRFASEVIMLVRGDKMRASHHMREKVSKNPKIVIKYQTQVIDVYGSNILYPILGGVTVAEPGRTYNITAAGLFYAIGHTPNTSFLNGALTTDDSGYLITTNTVTQIPGVFACGDVQDRIYRQAITAAGSGCMAALEAERYLTSSL